MSGAGGAPQPMRGECPSMCARCDRASVSRFPGASRAWHEIGGQSVNETLIESKSGDRLWQEAGDRLPISFTQDPLRRQPRLARQISAVRRTKSGALSCISGGDGPGEADPERTTV